MNLKRVGRQKGLTVVEYVIGAAMIVIFTLVLFSGMATNLISAFVSIISGI